MLHQPHACSTHLAVRAATCSPTPRKAASSSMDSSSQLHGMCQEMAVLTQICIEALCCHACKQKLEILRVRPHKLSACSTVLIRLREASMHRKILACHGLPDACIRH